MVSLTITQVPAYTGCAKPFKDKRLQSREREKHYNLRSGRHKPTLLWKEWSTQKLWLCSDLRALLNKDSLLKWVISSGCCRLKPLLLLAARHSCCCSRDFRKLFPGFLSPPPFTCYPFLLFQLTALLYFIPLSVKQDPWYATAAFTHVHITLAWSGQAL